MADCAPVEIVMEQIESRGGSVVELVNTPGLRSDQMLIVTLGGIILAVLVDDGCIASAPQPVDIAVPERVGT